MNEKFGKYCLIKHIKTAGMAEVYLAQYIGAEGFEKLLVIKKILPHLSRDEYFINMFISEAKLSAQLNHQNIVQVIDFGKIEETYYIAMEYVNGKNLRELLLELKRQELTLSVEHAVAIVCDVLKGLDVAHRQKQGCDKPLNIVHRDVSPENIILSYEGEVKLLDFGIAKADQSMSQTVVGSLKGKFAYMSPEQTVVERPIDKRSDIFSIGVVLYELLTGTNPFKSDDYQNDLFNRIRTVDIKPPRELNEDISEKLEAILLKSISKAPNDRFQTAAEMKDELEKILQSQNHLSYSLGDFMTGVFSKTIEKEEEEIREYLKTDVKVSKHPSKSDVESDDSSKGTTLKWLGILLVGSVAFALIFMRNPKPQTKPAPEEKKHEELTSRGTHETYSASDKDVVKSQVPPAGLPSKPALGQHIRFESDAVYLSLVRADKCEVIVQLESIGNAGIVLCYRCPPLYTPELVSSDKVSGYNKFIMKEADVPKTFMDCFNEGTKMEMGKFKKTFFLRVQDEKLKADLEKQKKTHANGVFIIMEGRAVRYSKVVFN